MFSSERNLRHIGRNTIQNMSRYILILFFALPTFLIGQSNDYLKFETENIHLGKVVQGEKVDSAFTFTNVSDEDVVIDLVSTCECTKANWPKTAIKPGETKTLDFVFDSSTKETEEELAIDVFLTNEDADGNPTVIFLYYTYEY